MTILNENSSALYTASLKDPEGVAVTKDMLESLSLTWYDPDREDEIVNGREVQDVFDTNNVTIDVNGVLSWEIQPEDTIILNATKRFERRKALFHFVWSEGEHFHEASISIRNLHLVPE